MLFAPSFDRNVLAKQLVDLSFFHSVPEGPVKTALRAMVANYSRAAKHGMRKDGIGNQCRLAEKQLNHALEASGTKREDVPGFAAFQDVIDRILLLDIAPEMRASFYRDLSASRTVKG